MSLASNKLSVDTIKSDIQHRNQMFNRHQEQLRAVKKRSQLQKQQQQEQQINKRIMSEAQQEQRQHSNKKSYIQTLLAREYQKQIEECRERKKEEINKNRSYAKIEEQYQEDFASRRARDLAKIYKTQNNTLNAKSSQDNQEDFIAKFQYRHPKAVTETSPDNNQSYKDYLQHQIQKRKQKQLQQIRQQKSLERLLQQKNKQAVEKQVLLRNQIKRKQQQIFRKGLQDQIQQKRQYRFPH